MGRSVARHLHAHGMDVFVGCMRGHGDGLQRSGAAGHWTPGDHAALDLPAMVKLIRKVTGRIPALVGHSLGGLVSLMYLAGATSTKGGTTPHQLASARRRRLVSSVTAIAPPLAFPSRSIGLFGDKPDRAGKLVCRFGASDMGRRLLDRVPTVPLQQGIRRLTGAPGPVGRVITAGLVKACRGNAARGFWRPENMGPDVIAAELTRTLDATSGAELHQMASWVTQGGLPAEWYEALRWVKNPTLIIAGEKDGVSTLEGVTTGASMIGGDPRRLMVVEDAGHNDLRVGVRATTHVYPAVTDWIHKYA